MAALGEAAAPERGPEPPSSPILWHSNAPWAGTGYGNQTATFAPRVAERLGYDVAISAFYGLAGSRLGWASPSGRPYVIYPKGRELHSNDVIGAHCMHFFKGRSGGMCFLLTDPWVMEPKIMQQIPTVSWVPIDHDPLMPRTRDWFQRTNAIAIAMSRFGQEMLAKEGIESLYVPHGFDPTIFYPADKMTAREKIRVPKDAFVVGMVAANKGFPGRKGFPQAIKAVADVARKHKDVVLYMHTNMEQDDGEDLYAICESVGIRPYVADQYGIQLGQPTTHMADTMNAIDVLLNPAWGEGFGVPLIEAQACGTPCITTNFSSMPEVAPVKAGNWTVEGQKVWTGFESWQKIVNIDLLTETIEAAYKESESKRATRSAKVHKHAMETYQADRITDEYFGPALAAAKNEFLWRNQKMIRY